MPAEVQKAMDDQAASELAVGRAKVEQFLAFTDRMGEARSTIAAVLVADPDDIALTHSTTDGINLALSSLTWRAGDRVLTTNHEHPGVLGPLQALHDRVGVEVELLDVGDGGDDDLTIEAFRRALERPVRGRRLQPRPVDHGGHPPRRPHRDARPGRGRGRDHRRRAGGRGHPARPRGPRRRRLRAARARSGCWGPRAWARCGRAGRGRTRSCRRRRATLGYAQLDPRGHAAPPRRPPVRGGVFHRPSVIGLARSCGWLSMYVGLPWATERAGRLAAAAADRLASIDGVSLVTPRGNPMATLVTFRIAGWPAADAAAELGARTFAIIRDLPPIDAHPHLASGSGTPRTSSSASPGRRRAARRPHAGVDPARRTLAVLGSDGQPLRLTRAPGVAGPAPRPEVRRRGFVEVRWRQFRHAPRPVFRAVDEQPRRRARPGLLVPRLRHRARPRRGPPGRRPAAARSSRCTSRSCSSPGRCSPGSWCRCPPELGARRAGARRGASRSACSRRSRSRTWCSWCSTRSSSRSRLIDVAPAGGTRGYHRVRSLDRPSTHRGRRVNDERDMALPKLYGAPAYARPPALPVAPSIVRSIPTTCPLESDQIGRGARAAYQLQAHPTRAARRATPSRSAAGARARRCCAAGRSGSARSRRASRATGGSSADDLEPPWGSSSIGQSGGLISRWFQVRVLAPLPPRWSADGGQRDRQRAISSTTCSRRLGGEAALRRQRREPRAELVGRDHGAGRRALDALGPR